MLRRGALNSLSELSITKLDVLDPFDTVRVCVAYEADAPALRALPRRPVPAAQGHAGLQDLPGWGTDLSSATEPGGLPDAARDYIAFLEVQVGVPIRLVGVGPGRDQYVQRTR
jgi:adenylosuccinate synthase